MQSKKKKKVIQYKSLPSLVDELDEGQTGVLLNGVLPLLNTKETLKYIHL